MNDLIRRIVLINGAVLFLTLGLSGCQTSATPLEQPASTPPIVPTASPTLAVPTQVLIPTSTPDPLIEQARLFAGPILEAIVSRPPDYQNDFSDPTGGWDIQSYTEGERSGQVGYENGEYFLIADAASAQYPNVHSWLQVPGLSVSDFVMEFDFRLVKAGIGGVYPSFRLQGKDVYVVNLGLEGFVNLSTQTVDRHQLLAETQTGLFEIGKDIHLSIIAKGSRIALYLDDQPVLMAEEEFLEQGGVILGIWNGSDVPMQVNFDNFKVWNISNLP